MILSALSHLSPFLPLPLIKFCFLFSFPPPPNHPESNTPPTHVISLLLPFPLTKHPPTQTPTHTNRDPCWSYGEPSGDSDSVCLQLYVSKNVPRYLLHILHVSQSCLVPSAEGPGEALTGGEWASLKQFRGRETSLEEEEDRDSNLFYLEISGPIRELKFLI